MRRTTQGGAATGKARSGGSGPRSVRGTARSRAPMPTRPRRSCR
ncbi:protein of unassigned function [Methylobacterium oryzae CBMB20]|uniref:Protein of unassigned function n=1 Tax=Methylobacterium oryzae CBMB20 TaxID=693986 RepID=A0A089Q7I6_9HYPH|nr:protein of unassigned function [Methylobacterium oryzae CBMB20]